MAKTMPFPSTADENLDTNTAISALIGKLNEQTLINRDDLALWLRDYVPLAYEAKDNEGVDLQCQLIASKLKEGVGYVKGYHYFNVLNQDDMPPKAYADTALVETVASLSAGKPVHPAHIMACLNDYIDSRREVGAIKLDL